MSFISYAQNFEDILLWRALKHIDGGFYIDVGANDPTIDSVTRAFYDRGWSGINIEPALECYDRLCDERPRDINLAIAVAEVEGKQTFFEISTKSWSTLDETVAESHKQLGHVVVERQIQVKTLNQVCAEYVKGPIHFLKIDVEGAEEKVLQGLDLIVWRPWILIIESTLPNTQFVSYHHWETAILSKGYDFIYFDGLNRYYLAQEHKHLNAAFSSPPNVFDEFKLREEHYFSFPLAQSKKMQDAEEKIWQVQEKVKVAEERMRASEEWGQSLEKMTLDAQARLHDAEVRAQTAESVIMAMQLSLSWRVTAPLRASKRLLKKALVLIRSVPRKLLQTTLLYVGHRPKLATRISYILNYFPSLKKRVNAFVCKTTGQPAFEQTFLNADLTASARKIYQKIHAQTQQNQNAADRID